jgi:RNA recognition motif-containing protein
MFKIFVGNLTPNTTVDAIRTLFSKHADVDDVALAINPETGKPRGFAIVMIRDEQQGRTAIQLLRGARLNGKALIINQARKKGAPKPVSRRGGPGFRSRGGGNFRGSRSGQGFGGSGGSSRGGSADGGERGYSPRARAFGNRPPRRPSDHPDRPPGDSRDRPTSD